MSAPVRCPKCQSLYVEVDGERAICRNCDARLLRTGESWRVDAAAGTGRGWMAGGAALLVVIAAVVGLTQRGGEGPATAPPADAPAVDATPQGPAKAEVLNVRDGQAGDTRFWLATVRNGGGEPLGHPAIVVRLLDAAGAEVGRVDGDAALDVLAPGATAPAFAFSADLPAFVVAEVVAGPVEDGDATWKKPLDVTGVADKPMALGATLVAGQVTNPHAQGARFVDVKVVGVDEAGRPVAWATGGGDVPDLPPGATRTFTSRVSAFKVEEPHHYEAYAQGNLH